MSHSHICTLDVEPNETIKMIKLKIEWKGDIPVETIKWIQYAGGTLEDEKTLSYYNIQKESTIRVYLAKPFFHPLFCARAYARMRGTLTDISPHVATCPDMQKNESCSVYNNFINYKYSERGLYHMQTHQHFGLKRKHCRYGVECKAYKRLMNNGVRLDDRCHIAVFCHPPRRDQEYNELNSKIYPLICGSANARNDALWGKNGCGGLNRDQHNVDDYDDEKTKEEFNKYVKDWNYPSIYVEDILKSIEKDKKDEAVLSLLVKEVENNSDSTAKTAQSGNYKLDLITTSGKTLIQFVRDTYVNHPRHVKMGKPLAISELFSIVLYTGSYCNYDLCRSQRSGNFRKWPVFDYCLNNAISKLATHEKGRYPVYTGIGGCQIDFKNLDKNEAYYMSTFVSTSCDVNIAKRFLGDKGGVIIAVDPNSRNDALCGDVSWISKFGESEKEVLFSRQRDARWKFQFRDNIGNIQRVTAANNGVHGGNYDLFYSWNDNVMPIKSNYQQEPFCSIQ
eukprot:430584_1